MIKTGLILVVEHSEACLCSSPMYIRIYALVHRVMGHNGQAAMERIEPIRLVCVCSTIKAQEMQCSNI